MTEKRMSYLTGFTAENYYAANGLFAGSLSVDDGFMASILLRDINPMGEADGDDFAIYCGNYTEEDDPAMRGWAMSAERTNLDDWNFAFNYAGAAGAASVACAAQITGAAFAQRTVLITVVFGVIAGKALNAVLWVNGSPISGASTNVAAGFVPANAGDPFRIGFGELAGVGWPANHAGIAGFAFSNTKPPNVASMSAICQAQWASVLEAQDMTNIGVPQFTDVFSVRRGLPDCDPGLQPTWEATNGGAILTRQGAASLSVEAGMPVWYSGPVAAVVPPVP